MEEPDEEIIAKTAAGMLAEAEDRRRAWEKHRQMESALAVELEAKTTPEQRQFMTAPPDGWDADAGGRQLSQKWWHATSAEDWIIGVESREAELRRAEPGR